MDLVCRLARISWWMAPWKCHTFRYVKLCVKAMLQTSVVYLFSAWCMNPSEESTYLLLRSDSNESNLQPRSVLRGSFRLGVDERTRIALLPPTENENVYDGLFRAVLYRSRTIPLKVYGI